MRISEAESTAATPEKREDWRAATATFAAVEFAALGVWLYLGRFQWFYRDEWDFLARRSATDIHSIFQSHNEHWTTVPILAYRALYTVFGLRSYLPYRLMVLAVYLTAAALLFVVMRRAAVHPWIATAAASLFVFFGAGWQNIIQPFQVCFTASLMFGLLQLVLADHDGSLDRNDWLGVIAGLFGLMCSGIGVSMLIIVGISVWLRRGWRLASFHTVPGATCYILWLAVIGRKSYRSHHVTSESVFRFIATAFRGAYGALGQVSLIGPLLAVVLVLGVALSVGERRRAGRRAELGPTIALLIGSVVFLTITAVGRAEFGSSFARESRYVSLVAAMMLPALAVAADALARRWRRLLPFAVAIFLVGIPGNISALAHAQRKLKPTYSVTRRMILSLPRVPRARNTPRSVHPDQIGAPAVTIGWLLDGVQQDRIPSPGRISPHEQMSADFRLAFDRSRAPAPTRSCRVLVRPTRFVLERGDTLGLFEHSLVIRPANGWKLVGPSLLFIPQYGSLVTVLRNPGPIWLRPASPFLPPRICVERPHARS